MANKFTGEEPWEAFVLRLEQSDPPIRALGVTDYWNLDDYRTILTHKAKGRLPDVDLIFPNIELRLDIHTEKKAGINLHLLFSPDDPHHVSEIERFLTRLTFSYSGKPYECSRSGIARLGRAFDSAVTEEARALEIGANQFKVPFNQLQSRWQEDAWVQQNCLVAVSRSSNDGTAGLAADDSYKATREEIERFAHIIFSSQPKQRDFWLGRGILTQGELEAKKGGIKPCMHGSDAHTQAKVGVPPLNRYTWVKGDPTFESLRQACIEPENRAIVAEQPPSGALPANTISQINISNAPWLPQATVPLNPGLIAIIGARGSGKTALADLIAAGGYAASSHLNDRSFLHRAREHLQATSTELTWQDGEITSATLSKIEFEEQFNEPRVQYLSQQFVDPLCSAEGLDNSLISEIERVIFNAHSVSDRMGASTFRELLEIRLDSARAERNRSDAELVQIAQQIAEERTRKAGLAKLQQQRKDKSHSTEKNKKDRGDLLSKGKASDAKQLDQVRGMVELKRHAVGGLKQVERGLRGLGEDVSNYRSRTLPDLIANLELHWVDAGLNATDWKEFKLDFKGDVEKLLAAKLKATQQALHNQEGPPEPPTIMANAAPANLLITPLPADVPLADIQLRTLEREMKRLNALVSVDSANARKLSDLAERISREERELQGIDLQIERAKAADDKLKQLQGRRTAAYTLLLDAIIQEQNELTSLYEPLGERLSGEAGSLGKLSFYVRRSVDLARWADVGEALLDLRKGGVFRGKGTLYNEAKKTLLKPWRDGTAADASEALAEFRERFDEKLMEHAPMDKSDKEDYLHWGQSVAQWLYSAEHISVAYDLRYDGVGIEQLSPGTRGIVLLLLYLAVDAEDARPLLIDQPEENLDPQSVVTDLVDRFREARARRQIIIVTHNANLVVNTDVDQVIVAHSGSHKAGELPTIEYESGGLEQTSIRNHVCTILEGGERAFKERARRLRMSLN